MKALIVVDYQNDFVTGSLGFEKAKDLEGPICRKIEEYLARDDLVLFTKDAHDPKAYPDTLEGKHLPVKHCDTEEGMAIYSSMRAWRIPMERSLAGCCPWGCKESVVTE